MLPTLRKKYGDLRNWYHSVIRNLVSKRAKPPYFESAPYETSVISEKILNLVPKSSIWTLKFQNCPWGEYPWTLLKMEFWSKHQISVFYPFQKLATLFKLKLTFQKRLFIVECDRIIHKFPYLVSGCPQRRRHQRPAVKPGEHHAGSARGRTPEEGEYLRLPQ